MAAVCREFESSVVCDRGVFMSSARNYEFFAIAGKSRPPSSTFLSSLGGDACLKISADHWLATVLPSHCPALGVGTARKVALRLVLFVFVPAIMFEDALLHGDSTFFPLPLPLGTFLQSLLSSDCN